MQFWEQFFLFQLKLPVFSLSIKLFDDLKWSRRVFFLYQKLPMPRRFRLADLLYITYMRHQPCYVTHRYQVAILFKAIFLKVLYILDTFYSKKQFFIAIIQGFFDNLVSVVSELSLFPAKSLSSILFKIFRKLEKMFYSSEKFWISDLLCSSYRVFST